MSNNALAVVDGEVVSNSAAIVASKDENAGYLMRRATDVAGVCREIVLKTAVQIQGRKFVRAEGWTSIAVAYGCIASARDVEKVAGGMRAIGELRRMSDGKVLATAEGFVGDDESTWAGRPEYARRAMAQTRSISRVCRSAFSFVVTLIDSDLSTTPAEEVPEGGFHDASRAMPAPAGVDKLREQVTQRPAASPPKASRLPIVDAPSGEARTHDGSTTFAFGKSKGIAIEAMDENSLSFYAGAFRRDLESTDPAKVKWADKTRQQLAAVESELRFRGLPV